MGQGGMSFARETHRFALAVVAAFALASACQKAEAAWYFVCNAVVTGNVFCPSFGWVEVGKYPANTQSIWDSGYGFRPYTYVGNVMSGQCSIDPQTGYASTGSGPYCISKGGTWSLTSMTITNPISCIPSGRTIDPCPSGFAPASVTSETWAGTPAYSSVYEKLPLQDMVYAAFVSLCGLLGVGVGVRLS